MTPQINLPPKKIFIFFIYKHRWYQINVIGWYDFVIIFGQKYTDLREVTLHKQGDFFDIFDPIQGRLSFILLGTQANN